MRWSKDDLVAAANFWITEVCRQAEVPGLQPKTLGKMGLRGVIFFSLFFVFVRLCVKDLLALPFCEKNATLLTYHRSQSSKATAAFSFIVLKVAPNALH